MSDTPPGAVGTWVDLTRESNQFSSPVQPSSPRRTTPVPFNTDTDYLKMLREAQRENSARSSARVSPISSAMMSLSSTCKNTPNASPKSPPNSPNTELANFEENMKGVVVNREPEKGEELYMNWRSFATSHPSRTWRIASSKTSSASQSDSEEKKSDRSDYRHLKAALLASNFLSLALGTVVGYWLYKRGIIKLSS